MKHQVISSLKEIIEDRYLSVLLGVFVVLSLVALLFLGLNIHPTELQVVVHYTSFGTTNFYRDRWYYLLTFAFFVVVIAIAHVILTYRILSLKGRELAISFAWLGILMLIVATTLFYQVLRIASLS